MTEQGPVPTEVYQLCFQQSPWPALVVDRALLHVVDINQAALKLWPEIELPCALTELFQFDSQESLETLSSLSMKVISSTLRVQEYLSNWHIQAVSAKHWLIQAGHPDQFAQIEIYRQQSLNKSELITNLSHELRTPLTAILGWPEIVLDAPNMPPLALQAADAIRKDAQFLHHLLDDLIDLSCIEAGQLILFKLAEDFKEIIENTVHMLARRLENKELALELNLPTHSVMIHADSLRITQVVMNYLSNAIKYTPEGGQIVLKLEVQEDEAVLSLRDTGLGIAPELQAHVFERFVRADEVQLTSGAGIGLSLVKKLVEMHQGRCWLESIHGQGSTFFVALPLLQERSQSESSELQSSDVDLQTLHVVLIDENTQQLELLVKLLQSTFLSLNAYSSLPALDSLQQTVPHLILISTSLYNPHHLIWLKDLRNSELRIPILALSNSAMKGDHEKLLESGFDGSISKPFLKEDLLQYIQETLKRLNHV